MKSVEKRSDGRWDAWHIDNDRYLGSYPTEHEATRACMKNTSVSSLFEDMLAEDLFTDDEGNPIVTNHLARR